MKHVIPVLCLTLCINQAIAADLSGVFVDEQINAGNGETLVLNGMGLREKFWVDVYVGSLYLTS